MPRQSIDELFNCSATATDRIALEQLREENKESDNNRRKKLSDRQRRQEGDSHRQLHSHAAPEEVFPSLFIDRESANHRSREREPVTVHERTPPARQAGNDDDTQQSQSQIFTGPGPVIVVIMVMIVVVTMMTMAVMIVSVTLVLDAGGGNQSFCLSSS